ncbi:MAG: YlzJ-like family protein [Desulfotomaculales bacterium]
MILYTPLPLELVTEGLEKMKQPAVRTVVYAGVPLLLEETGTGTGKVVKLLSTEPQDYLRADLFPGAEVRY